MNWNKIIIGVCLMLVAMVSLAQVPHVCVQGKTASQECKDWVETRLAEMTLKEKIGQLFIHTVALQVTEQNKKNIRNAVREYKVGGLLFSGGSLINQVNLTN